MTRERWWRTALAAIVLVVGCGDGTGPAQPIDLVFALFVPASSFESELCLTNHLGYLRANRDPRCELIELPGQEIAPAWSPDGQQVVFARVLDGIGAKYGLWIVNADGTGLRQLQTGDGESRAPAWSPDGSRIAFMRQVDPQTWGIAVVNVDGTGLRWVVVTPDVSTRSIAPAWSPDGTKLAFTRNVAGGSGTEIWSVGADGTGLTRMTNGPFDFGPAWSRDGTRLAFSRANGSGESAIMIAHADGSAATPITSGSDDHSPTWSPDGSQLAFVRYSLNNRHVHVIAATGGESTDITGYAVMADYPAWRP